MSGEITSDEDEEKGSVEKTRLQEEYENEIERLRRIARTVLDTGEEHAWKLLAVFIVLLGLLPLSGLESGFWMTTIINMFTLAVLALSWDIVGGQTGYPSFGNMAFFGVGAYTTAILWKDFSIGLAPAVVSSAGVALVFAILIGLAVLRLRGGYFAIATLGVLLASIQMSKYLDITGGASGKILLGGPDDIVFYYFFLVLLSAEMVLILYLSRTRFGYVLNAIRDDERKASAMGFNTTYYKTTAWGIAAVFTGFAGGAWGVFNTFIDPQSSYNLAWNIEIIAMSLIGGAGTVAGPVLGAFGLHYAIVEIDSMLPGWQLLGLGVVVIVVVVAFPRGLLGELREFSSAMEYYEYGGQAAGETAGVEREGEREAGGTDNPDHTETSTDELDATQETDDGGGDTEPGSDDEPSSDRGDK